MYSAGTGQEALDRLNDTDTDPNSIYTRTLLPLLKTPGLSLSDIAKKVKAKVRDLAQNVGHDQTPAYYDEIIGDFFLAGKMDVSTSPERISRPKYDKAKEIWLTLKDTTSEAQLERFIREFGDSLYVPYAKARLKELQAAKKTHKKTQREKARRENNEFKREQRQRQWRDSEPTLPEEQEETARYYYVGPVHPPDPWLALRSQPSSTRGYQIMKMPEGTMFRLLRKKGRWYKIQLRNGLTGWAHSGWIRCCRYQ
jgi:hypothetical protein